ncbi:MAG: tRNA dimethylallyltransferase [Ferruginibacter sp.]
MVDEKIRKKINADYEWEGLEWLQKQVEQNDPLYYARGEIKNPHRLLRALEVKLSTGKSIIEFQTQAKKPRPFNIVKIGLHLPKEQLHKNINSRVDAMMKAGLLEEVKHLEKYKKLNALQTVGYRELFVPPYWRPTLARCRRNNKNKYPPIRQAPITWFNKDEEVKWCEPDFEKAMGLIKMQLTGQ